MKAQLILQRMVKWLLVIKIRSLMAVAPVINVSEKFSSEEIEKKNINKY